MRNRRPSRVVGLGNRKENVLRAVSTVANMPLPFESREKSPDRGVPWSVWHCLHDLRRSSPLKLEQDVHDLPLAASEGPVLRHGGNVTAAVREVNIKVRKKTHFNFTARESRLRFQREARGAEKDADPNALPKTSGILIATMGPLDSSPAALEFRHGISHDPLGPA